MVNDWGVGLPIMLSAFVGTIGFPVLLNIDATCRRRRGPRFWNLHTKMTLTSMVIVIAISMLCFLAVEWNNTQIYHQSDIASKIRDALTASMMPRTTGFDTSCMPYMSEPTKGFLSMVMFIGGGSTSTAGGIRVTTLAVLFLICRSVFDGRAQAMAFHRRIPSTTVRIAITIAISSLAVVHLATLSLSVVTGRSLSDCLFEVCSAFSLGGSTLGVGSSDNRGHC